MRIVVFGLTISSSWGNGHATLWRGLVKALTRHGHDETFFERDAVYYAGNRDLHALPGGELVIYPDWMAVEEQARHSLRSADVAIVTSYCPDAAAAERLVLDAPHALRVFYDLDTPVTLANLSADARPAFVGARGFADYDLVLSGTGGRALFAALPDDCLSFLLFPVDDPVYFDAVVCDDAGFVQEIQVTRADAASCWIWGAFKMPGCVLHDLHALWLARDRQDEYWGTLVNACLADGGVARGFKVGEAYVDVGTLNGYRAALGLLAQATPPTRTAVPVNHRVGDPGFHRHDRGHGS